MEATLFLLVMRLDPEDGREELTRSRLPPERPALRGVGAAGTVHRRAGNHVLGS